VSRCLVKKKSFHWQISNLRSPTETDFHSVVVTTSLWMLSKLWWTPEDIVNTENPKYVAKILMILLVTTCSCTPHFVHASKTTLYLLQNLQTTTSIWNNNTQECLTSLDRCIWTRNKRDKFLVVTKAFCHFHCHLPSAAAAEFQLNARFDAARMARTENRQCDYLVTFRDIKSSLPCLWYVI
jgi:hypothetical protein